ncbi:MAG: antitoxin [Candidatus Korarchaeota archaeon NZ13-K]|nr:MAG: antitoxin [Candidatus Korarchaeota archaeon NZ13-K]
MKNISLRDEVYEELSRLKREGESFSDVILRLIRGNRERSLEILRRYAGKLKDSDIEEIIMEERRGFWVREFDL